MNLKQCINCDLFTKCVLPNIFVLHGTKLTKTVQHGTSLTKDLSYTGQIVITSSCTGHTFTQYCILYKPHISLSMTLCMSNSGHCFTIILSCTGRNKCFPTQDYITTCSMHGPTRDLQLSNMGHLFVVEH